MHLSDKDNKVLSPIITRLSKKYVNGDVFPPHISICSPVVLEVERAKEIVDSCVENTKKFNVKKDSIKYADKWSKALFIQLKESEALSKISAFLSEHFQPDSPPYRLDPHISLLYKEGLKSDEKQKVASKLHLPSGYTVSSLALVSPGEDVKDWRDYGKWEVIYEKGLR